MKKVFLVIFFVLIYLNSFALNESCFEYVWTSSVPQNEIFLLKIDRAVDYVKTKDSEVNYKLYKEDSIIFDYDIKDISSSDQAFIKDWKYWTSYSLYLNKDLKNELVLDFGKEIGLWINPDVFIESSNYGYNISISNDNIKYDKVSLDNVNSFNFRYFKIDFFPRNISNQVSENIKVIDIVFTKKIFTYLINWNKDNNMKFYSNFYCSNDNDFKALEKYQQDIKIQEKNLLFKSWYKAIDTIMWKNITYTQDKWTDSDYDWINDNEDNCKSDYNPNQFDNGANWVWDLCDDNDLDWIVWKLDNCPFISNIDQKDVNNNKIWDVCEFDKDKDSIFDSIDNCINVPNPDQNDSDYDNIWDLCDNCNLYNPTQIDKNNNNVWDTCEEAEKYEKENDIDKDWFLDYLDNCKDISNPDQSDSDNDLIWDLCDSCKNIRNPDQKDLDKNGIWDMCEDSDNDGIIGYLDNCIYYVNTDQKDSDNNLVWDVCEDYDNDSILTYSDNCPYNYNIDQKDVDKDLIWDVCDDKDDRFIESNKTFFIWLLLTIVFAFAFLIFYMIKNLQKIKK